MGLFIVSIAYYVPFLSPSPWETARYVNLINPQPPMTPGGWLGSAMVLDKLSVPGRPTNLD